MGRRADLIESYARELREVCGIEPDMDLLEKVVIGCGPAIFDPERAMIDPRRPRELEELRRNFLAGKLRLSEGHYLMEGIARVLSTYRPAGPRRLRAVVCYLLVREFAREALYGVRRPADPEPFA